jgi:hypothetical protein
LPRPSPKHIKPYKIAVDPRDPAKELWEWVHDDNHRRYVGSLTDEQAAQVSAGNLEFNRRTREAWVTDMEVLTRAEDTS